MLRLKSVCIVLICLVLSIVACSNDENDENLTSIANEPNEVVDSNISSENSPIFTEVANPTTTPLPPTPTAFPTDVVSFAHEKKFTGKGVIDLVSISSEGEQGDYPLYSDLNGRLIRDDNIGAYDISADGRYIVFDSTSKNLASVDGHYYGLFIHDMKTRETRGLPIYSHTLGREEKPDKLFSVGFSERYWPLRLSSNGKYLAFGGRSSEYGLWLETDTDFFLATIGLYDIENQTVERIDVGLEGQPGNGISRLADISGDGRYVLFLSLASNLVPDDRNNHFDVFLFDSKTKQTEILSPENLLNQVSGRAGYNYDLDDFEAVISENGRFIAFTSNLIAPGSADRDIILYDREEDIARRITQGKEAPFSSLHWRASDLSISADGEYLLFIAKPTVEFDPSLSPTHEERRLYLYSRGSNEISEVQILDQNGKPAKTSSRIQSPMISSDGKTIVFATSIDTIHPLDLDSEIDDVYILNMETDELELISQSNQGTKASSNYEFGSSRDKDHISENFYRGSKMPIISADSRYVIFTSGSDDLVVNDFNNAEDLFVYERQSVKSDFEFSIVLSNPQVRENINDDLKSSVTQPVELTPSEGAEPVLTPTYAEVVEIPANLPFSCNGAPVTRLNVGDRVYVVEGTGIGNLRDAPASGNILGSVEEGGGMLIEDGPDCVNERVWWFVRADNGLTGWTAEGRPGEYWLRLNN